MQLAIYRSVTRTIYPEDTLSFCYAFQPIPSAEESIETRLLSWTDDSGPDPFAVVEIPEGSQITHDDYGWYLHIPNGNRSVVLDAERVYEVAVDHSFGLSIVQEARVAVQRHYWVG
jgi:hypothetical protein